MNERDAYHALQVAESVLRQWRKDAERPSLAERSVMGDSVRAVVGCISAVRPFALGREGNE